MAEISAALQEALGNLEKNLSKNKQNSEEQIKLLEQIAIKISEKAGKSREDLLREGAKKFKLLSNRVKRYTFEDAEIEFRRRYRKSKLGKTEKWVAEKYDFGSTVMGSFYSAMNPQINSLSEFFGKLSKIPVVGGIFATAGAALAVVDTLTKNYAALAKTGIQVSGGILGAAEATKRLGLSFSEGAKLLNENALLVKSMGLPAVTNFVNNVRHSSSELYAMGLSYEDVAKKSVEYLEGQRRLDSENLKNMTNREDAFKNQLKNFYKATQQVGVSLEDLMGQYKKSTDDPMTRLILMKLPKESQDAFIALQQTAPEIAEMMGQAILRDGSLERIDPQQYAKILHTGAFGDLKQVLNKLMTGTSIGEIHKVFANNEKFYEEQFKTFSDMMLTDNAKFVAELANLGNRYNEIPQMVANAVDPFTKSVIEGRAAINNAVADAQLATIQELQKMSNVLDSSGFASAIKTFLDMDNILNPLKEMFKGSDDKKPEDKQTLQQKFDEIRENLSLFETGDIAKPILASIGSMFLVMPGNSTLIRYVKDAFLTLGETMYKSIKDLPFDLPDLNLRDLGIDPDQRRNRPGETDDQRRAREAQERRERQRQSREGRLERHRRAQELREQRAASRRQTPDTDATRKPTPDADGPKIVQPDAPKPVNVADVAPTNQVRPDVRANAGPAVDAPKIAPSASQIPNPNSVSGVLETISDLPDGPSRAVIDNGTNAAQAATKAVDRASVIAKVSAAISETTIAKFIAKKVPGLSILAGLGFATWALVQGDFLGAGLELGSGIAATIPGPGTAISIGLDAASLLKDMAYMFTPEELEVAKEYLQGEISRLLGIAKSNAEQVDRYKTPVEIIDTYEEYRSEMGFSRADSHLLKTPENRIMENPRNSNERENKIARRRELLALVEERNRIILRSLAAVNEQARNMERFGSSGVFGPQ